MAKRVQRQSPGFSEEPVQVHPVLVALMGEGQPGVDSGKPIHVGEQEVTLTRKLRFFGIRVRQRTDEVEGIMIFSNIIMLLK